MMIGEDGAETAVARILTSFIMKPVKITFAKLLVTGPPVASYACSTAVWQNLGLARDARRIPSLNDGRDIHYDGFDILDVDLLNSVFSAGS